MTINGHMIDLVKEVFPICRSISGNGTRETLKIFQKYCPGFKIFEVPSGSKVFDWEIPEEWNIEEGYIEDETGRRIIDLKDNNLYIMSYSMAIDQWMDLDELKKNIYTIPHQADWIPYVTSYYERKTGFCMSQNMLDSLDNKLKYHAVIKSDFNSKGSMSYGELLIPGKSDKEIFLTTYICHPSMANNECSGPVVLTYLTDYILNLKKRNYTYRIVMAPETIGAITYLSKNLEIMKQNMIAGFILTCVGDDRNYSIVHSRYADNMADKVLKNILKFSGKQYKEFSFLDRGSDERQYCAPGVDLPVCTFCRTKFYEYPEYHTSADDFNVVTEKGLRGSLEIMKECISALEENKYYLSTCICEPQLGRRGLYPLTSIKGVYNDYRKIQDFLMYADGKNDLIDISNIIGYPLNKLVILAEKLVEAGLIEETGNRQNAIKNLSEDNKFL